MYTDQEALSLLTVQSIYYHSVARKVKINQASHVTIQGIPETSRKTRGHVLNDNCVSA